MGRPPLCPAPMHRTSIEERWGVIAFWKDGMSTRDVAHKLRIPHATVGAIIQRYRRTGSVDDAIRRRSLRHWTPEALKYLKRAAQGKGGYSTRRAARVLLARGVHVSHTTVGLQYRRWGWVLGHSHRTSGLTPVQIAKRIKWCREFKSMTKLSWRSAIFVDEKNFGETWPLHPVHDPVYGPPGGPWPERPVKKFQVNVKVALALSYHGLSAPCELSKWTVDEYVHFLDEVVEPMRVRHFAGWRVHLVMDSDPVHLGAPAKYWLREHQYEFEGDWAFPSNSGDLNPVENVWSIILGKMEGKELKTKAQLLAAIRAAAAAIPVSVIQRMVDSMPVRIAACLAAKGSKTRW